MSDLFVTGLHAATQAVEDAAAWRTVPCAAEGCENETEALLSLSKDGQHELFPETEPVFCEGCQDAMADEHEAEFGWMRSY